LGARLLVRFPLPRKKEEEKKKPIYTDKCHSLQYQNRKAEYFSAIWDIINWKAVEKRFT
jgi:hypothetical protein